MRAPSPLPLLPLPLSLVALACAGACKLIGAAPLPCQEDADCPGSVACIDRFCSQALAEGEGEVPGEGEGEGEGDAREGEGEGEGEGDAGEGEGEGEGEGDAPPGCPLLLERFDDALEAEDRWAGAFDNPPFATFAIVDRRLRFDHAPGEEGFAGLVSPSVAGHVSVTARLVTPPAAGSGVGAFLFAETEGGDVLGFRAGGTELGVFDGAEEQSFPYDPARQSVVRVRLDGGDVAFQTSADGVQFVELHRATAPAVFETEPFSVVVHAGGTASAASVVEWDDVRIESIECADACAPALADAFDGGAVDVLRWPFADNDAGASTRVEDGALIATLPANGSAANAAIRTDLFELRGHSLEMRVVTLPTVTDAVVYLGAVNADAQLYFDVADDTLEPTSGAGALANIPLGDPADLRYVRLRFDVDAQVFETSRDGLAWSTVFSTPFDDDVSQAGVAVGGFASAALPSAIEVALDDVVVRPGGCP